MTPEEMIQAGQVPAESPEAVITEQVVEQPVVAELTNDQKRQLEAEAEADFNTLPAAQVRMKQRLSPDYSAALERVLSGRKTAEEVPVVPTPVVPAVVEQPVIPAAEVPVTSAPVEEATGPYTKTANGWEARIDLGDGSGVQVFKGRTKDDVSAKLVKAQINATKELRRLSHERELLETFDASNLDKMKPAETGKVLSADEVYKTTNELHDPATAIKAFRKLLYSEIADPTSEIGARIRKSDEILAFESSKEIARQWMRKTPGFYNDANGQNIQTIYRFFVKHNLEVTEKNLDTVFNVLRSKSVLLDAPIEEVEPETSATPAASTPAPSAPTAPAAANTPAPKAPASSPAPAPAPQGRTRPGSVSTGLSPREASVRPGATGGVPVGLTVEEYRKLPISDVKRRYQSDPAFRSGVDRLIAEGKI